MASWDGKSRTGVTGYQIFVLTLRYGGLLAAYFILRFVALYYFLFSYKSTKSIYAYFNQRLAFSKLASLPKVYSSYYVFGQTLIDRVAIMAGFSNRYTFDFDGEEHLHEIVRQGKGGLLISAHAGNWEIAGYLLHRIPAKIHVVMHEAEHEKVKQYLDQVKNNQSMQVIVMKEDLSHIYQIAEVFQKGEILCIHGDRYMPWSKTLQTLLLGKEARFPQGPFALATAFKVPVSFVFAMKEGNYHYRLSATSPQTYRTQSGQTKTQLVQHILEEYVQEIRKILQKYPLQWFNYYDFWAAEKPSVPVSTSEYAQ